MKEKETKIIEQKTTLRDIKKKDLAVQTKKTSIRNKSFRNKFFLKLFILVIPVISLALYMAFLFISNKDDSIITSQELNKKFSYYTHKIKNSLSFSNIYLDENDISTKKTDSELELPRETLEESSTMEKSKNKNWWLNSGGIMYFQENGFSTNIGSLSEDSIWRKLYAKSNPRDTDNGCFPQNIFRLVNKQKFKNFSQSVYFDIKKINLSESEYRNESNGVLLFNRYQDGDNLYYTGIRVDGHIVVKKKIDGDYFTMIEKNIFKNKNKYDKENNPNLIPQNSWIGIKSQLINTDSDEVEIKVFVDFGEGKWELVVETIDREDKYGNTPFLEKGFVGIRTDFMDVNFKNYTIENK